MPDNVFMLAAFALLAAFGALARQLNQHSGALNLTVYISGCVIAAFMGVILYFVTDNYAIPASLGYAISGVSGWIGPQVLDFVSETILKKIGYEQKTQEHKEGKMDNENHSKTE